MVVFVRQGWCCFSRYLWEFTCLSLADGQKVYEDFFLCNNTRSQTWPVGFILWGAAKELSLVSVSLCLNGFGCSCFNPGAILIGLRSVVTSFANFISPNAQLQTVAEFGKVVAAVGHSSWRCCCAIPLCGIDLVCLSAKLCLLHACVVLVWNTVRRCSCTIFLLMYSTRCWNFLRHCPFSILPVLAKLVNYVLSLLLLWIVISGQGTVVIGAHTSASTTFLITGIWAYQAMFSNHTTATCYGRCGVRYMLDWSGGFVFDLSWFCPGFVRHPCNFSAHIPGPSQ